MAQSRRQWLEPKDYLTITLSLLALLISSGGAYFTILRTDESIILISDREPWVNIADDEMLEVPPETEGEVIFVNSGNRAGVISSIAVSYIQPMDNIGSQCSSDSGVRIRTDFDSAVIKPNEVLVKKFKLARAAPYSFTDVRATSATGGAFLFPIAAHNKGKKEIMVDVCLDIALSTPSTIYHHVEFPVFRYTALRDGWSYDPESGPLRTFPTLLISRRGTIFE
jgi:hypothetical protein